MCIRDSVTADLIREGAVVLDVGVSRGPDGKLAGDVAPSAWEKASAIAPNPGGCLLYTSRCV